MHNKYCIICHNTDCNNHGKNITLYGEFQCNYIPFFTNADKIRSMTDEQLAEFLEGDYGNFETGKAIAWLKQPAEGE